MLSSIAQFFSWWGRELAALVPGPLRRIVSPDQETLIVGVGDSGVSLRRARGANIRILGEVEATGNAATLNVAVRSMLRKANPSRCTVALRLPQTDALQTTVTLPSAAEENLREVLQFEMDRLTPFRAEEVYFGYRVLSSDADSQQVQTAVTVVPRQTVDRALGTAGAWGLDPDIVDVAEPNAQASFDTNLLPPRIEGGGRIKRLLTFAFVVGALILGFTAITLPLDRKEQLIGELRAQVRDARKDADAVAKLREQIDLADRSSRFLSERKVGYPIRTEIINEVSRILPDGTWLQRLKISEGEIDLSGFSPKSSALLSLLEESDLLEGARFRSPVTQDPRTGVERFNLTIRVVGSGKTN